MASLADDNPHTNASFPSFFHGLRAMFYLLSPSESSFERMSDVPDYVGGATPHFFILIITEILILFLKGKDLRINDKLTSVGAGMYSQVLGLMGLKTLEFSLYVKVYDNYHIYDLPWDSVWTWILMALAYDVLYYWFHRLAHGKFFYLPAALLVPPSVYVVHKQLNLLYQFWIHTELVDSLGPLEYILNTPSHHRVHHGRNPYCIDRNYAAVLIIWDRMFGTFQPELKEEKVVYGLVHPINTFDSNAIQIQQPVTVYNPEVSNWLNVYVMAHFMVAVSIYNSATYHHLVLPSIAIFTACAFILASLTCFGYLFDKRSFGPAAEFLRCTICASISYRYCSYISKYLSFNEGLVMILSAFFLLSSLVWPLVGVGGKKDREKTS